MRGQSTSSGVRAGKDIGSRSTISTAPARPARSIRTSPAERLLQRRYRDLTRKHLGRLLDRLFAEVTGLHFHVAWAPSGSCGWDTCPLPISRSACCRLAAKGLDVRAICRTYGSRQLVRTLNAAGKGHRFDCPLGVRNCWLPIRVRGVTVGIAYLQALDATRLQKRVGKHSDRAREYLVSPLAFQRASQLLRLMVEHVQTLDLADLRKTELSKAGRAVVALEKEQARLHQVLQRHLPDTPETFRCSAPRSQPEYLVQQLLGCVEQNYGKSITLQNCACKLGINMTYASALFSRATGKPFKTYLTGHRIEKAKVLLNDSSKSVSDVATAVGYASENRFRAAFKKATGLAPRVWRETMRVNPSQGTENPNLGTADGRG